MAETHSTQPDHSRFQLRSYGWRKVDINADRAINLLEQSFKAANGISGIVHALRSGMGDGDMDEGTLNAYQVTQLLSAIEQLADSVTSDICGYAESIEEKIKALESSDGEKQ